MSQSGRHLLSRLHERDVRRIARHGIDGASKLSAGRSTRTRLRDEVRVMLRSLKVIEQFKVGATNGDIGSVVNFLIDDVSWAVRYLVVDAGGIFTEREVLVSPISFLDVDYSASRFRLTLTVDKIRNSPSINLELPVSRQHERDYGDYYGYSDYWGFGSLWGTGLSPRAMASRASTERTAADRPGEPASDVHLRSARDLTGYHIEATDGSIGHVRDFIVDDETWQIRYLVIDTTNWWPGKRVLVAPEWATRISWLDRKVYLGMTRDAIKRSPEWSATFPVAREYEELLHQHYGRIPGWGSRDRSFAEDRIA
jgi:hypothetical protein